MARNHAGQPKYLCTYCENAAITMYVAGLVKRYFCWDPKHEELAKTEAAEESGVAPLKRWISYRSLCK